MSGHDRLIPNTFSTSPIRHANWTTPCGHGIPIAHCHCDHSALHISPASPLQLAEQKRMSCSRKCSRGAQATMVHEHAPILDAQTMRQVSLCALELSICSFAPSMKLEQWQYMVPLRALAKRVGFRTECPCVAIYEVAVLRIHNTSSEQRNSRLLVRCAPSRGGTRTRVMREREHYTMRRAADRKI